ncbi:hypothetical protein LC612_28325 [Nostoc sp. CHAB 5834]|nr:hypothetical protein [Nostoc sp. CHAB 5834]
MKRLSSYLVLAAAVFAGQVGAKEASFCRSPSVNFNQSNGSTFTSDKTVFTCGNGLEKSLPDLYKLGWRVINVHYQVYDPLSNFGFAQILIEKE